MSCRCHQFEVSRKGRVYTVTLPSWLPARGWSLSVKGYVIYTSRLRGAALKRGAKLHRVVAERLLGRPLTEDEVVHHQDSDARNCCPQNLVIMPAAFNPRSAIRDPYTGQYLSLEEYRRRYARRRVA